MRPIDTPRFTHHDRLANPGFSKIVDQLVADLSSLDMPDNVCRFLQTYARKGRDSAVAMWLKRDYGSTSHHAIYLNRPDLSCAFMIGDWLIGLLVAKHGSDIFPANDIELHLGNNEIAIASSSMLQRDYQGQSVYFSKMRFTICVDGEVKPLALTCHAMQRFCERYKPDYLTYGGLGDAHGLLATMNYVRPEELFHEGKLQAAVAIFDILQEGCWEYQKYVGKFVKEPISGTNYAFRVGYFPLIKTDEFFLARTFLPPGYKGTPERRLLETSELKIDERRRLISLASDINANSLRQNDVFEAIEWFHWNGVKQLITRREPVCDWSYVKKRHEFLTTRKGMKQ